MSKEDAQATTAKYDAPYDLRYNTNPVVNNTDGSIVGYKYFNFDSTEGRDNLQLLLLLTPEGIDGTIEIMADHPWTSQGGKLLGTYKLSANDGTQKTWVHTELPELGKLKGKHAIFFVFKSDTKGKSLCTLHELVFQ